MKRSLSILLFSFSMLLLTGLSVQAQEYKEVSRTYVNLTNIDFSECLNTFRLLNGNYMDCSRRMMNFVSDKMDNITSTRYPIQTYTFPLAGTELEFYLRIETSGSQASDERIWISGYYQKTGRAGFIKTLSPEFYSPGVLMSYLNQALLKISQNGGWTSEWSFIAIPKPSTDSIVRDKVLASIYVARRRIELNMEDCKKTFHAEEVDAWPNENYWYSSCSVRVQPDHFPIPLNRSQWNSELQSAANDEILIPGMSLTFSAGGYDIGLYGKKTWDEIKEDVEAVMEKAQYSVVPYFIIKDSELWTLTEKDELLGRLVFREGLLGIGTH